MTTYCYLFNSYLRPLYLRKSHFLLKKHAYVPSYGTGRVSKAAHITLSEMIDRTQRPRIKLHR